MIIQEYTKRWQKDFEDIRQILQSALHHLEVSIEHIGSTSVPGLASKPIIDIDIVYVKNVLFDDVNMGLQQVGYYHNGDQGIEGREVFKRCGTTLQTHEILDSIIHHLYVCRLDSIELKRHLLFRDYLRSNPAARNEYEQLKRDIAKKADDDSKVYARIKEEQAKGFIDDVIKKAGNAK